MRLAGEETGNGNGGKSDGDDNKVGGQATASNGKGGRRLMVTMAMAAVAATTWVMATVTATKRARVRVRVARGAKRFPVVYRNHKFTALVARQVCSNKQCLVVVVLYAESFGQMECMVTACVEGEPVRWRIRQQQE
jgi:hypothetical protein